MIKESTAVIYEGVSPSLVKCQLTWDKAFKVAWASPNGERYVESYHDYSQAYDKYCALMEIKEIPLELEETENQYQNRFKAMKVFMVISVCWSLMAMVKGVSWVDVLAGFFIINIMGMAFIKIKIN